jgi:hypothetical protein
LTAKTQSVAYVQLPVTASSREHVNAKQEKKDENLTKNILLEYL